MNEDFDRNLDPLLGKDEEKLELELDCDEQDEEFDEDLQQPIIMATCNIVP